LWGDALGQFCYLYQSYMIQAWLPLFLVQSQHRSLTVTAIVGAGIYATNAIVATVTGIVSDRMIAQGRATTQVRRAFMLSGTAPTGLAMLGACLSSGWVVIVFLALHAAVGGLVHPLMFCTGQTLGGPAAGGRWMGIQNLVGNLAGIVAPPATGFIVQATGSFSMAFGVAAATPILGLVCWGPMISRHEPVDWAIGRLGMSG
jgi:sugar phosphate permease